MSKNLIAGGQNQFGSGCDVFVIRINQQDYQNPTLFV